MILRLPLLLLTGPTAGFTVELPMGNGTTFGVDYSYTDTDPFKGSHNKIYIYRYI